MTKKPVGPKTEEKHSERSDDKVTPLRAARPCPECGKPSTRQSFPFCSERCRSVDLNRWLSGVYVERLFGPEEDEEDDPGASG